MKEGRVSCFGNVGCRPFVGYKETRNGYPTFSRLKSGRRPAVAEVEVTGNVESDKLMEWHGVG